ncbi:hypothetical protein B0H13DRAFT_1913183 [Mycena leptocephala]|nr:hypothetical protein B0H13DRAFT_1921137 [Mycena leptocephala]KAJ7836300.1 hypothetical protein B0H13DRAFT_1913183 [Mycena leptocephala]
MCYVSRLESRLPTGYWEGGLGNFKLRYKQTEGTGNKKISKSSSTDSHRKRYRSAEFRDLEDNSSNDSSEDSIPFEAVPIPIQFGRRGRAHIFRNMRERELEERERAGEEGEGAGGEGARAGEEGEGAGGEGARAGEEGAGGEGARAGEEGGEREERERSWREGEGAGAEGRELEKREREREERERELEKREREREERERELEKREREREQRERKLEEEKKRSVRAHKQRHCHLSWGILRTKRTLMMARPMERADAVAVVRVRGSQRVL